MQLDDITLTADDHGAGRAAVERPPLPVDPARAARDADAAASLAAIGRDTIGFAGRPVLWPLLIGAKRKEQP
jgi:hypothetical protein